MRASRGRAAHQRQQRCTALLAVRVTSSCSCVRHHERVVNFRLASLWGALPNEAPMPGGSEEDAVRGLHASCVTCTATALNRIEFGCARCMYLLEWP